MISFIRLMIAAGFGLILAIAGGAQTIENTEKPKAPDAGRVIVPKEVLTITDESGEFFFKYPRGLKIGPEGSIIFTDGEQVLRFDKDGKLVRNYFKKGQGPGEMTQVDSYELFRDGRLAIHSYNPSKMIWFDAAGAFEKEISFISEFRRAILQGRFDKKWIFETYDFPRPGENARYVEVPHQLVVWDDTANEWTRLMSFDCTVYAASSGGAAGFVGIASFLAADLGGGLLAVSHTQEYGIKIVDVSANKVVREFRRKYERIAPPPLKPGQKRGSFGLNGKVFEEPERKFQSDFSSLQSVAGRIWVVTSTRDEKKGVLIDVFDIDGTYRDAFYLNLPEAALSRGVSLRFSPTGDAVFAVETTPDETIVIKKYALK
jgi:hypothetical protein